MKSTKIESLFRQQRNWWLFFGRASLKKMRRRTKIKIFLQAKRLTWVGLFRCVTVKKRKKEKHCKKMKLFLPFWSAFFQITFHGDQSRRQPDPPDPSLPNRSRPVFSLWRSRDSARANLWRYNLRIWKLEN